MAAIKGIWLGSILATFFIVGGLSIILGLNANNQNLANDQSFQDFNNSFNKINDLQASTDALQNSVTQEPNNVGIFGFLDALVNSAWNALKGTFAALGFMHDAVTSIPEVFEIPTWVGGLIWMALIAIIGYAIYSAIFQVDL